jgi:hypothetical protein
MILKTKKTKTKNPLDTLWAAYWQAKEQAKALQTEISELESKILEECHKQNLFKGQTATYGTNKVSFTMRPSLVVPKNFDFASFVEDFPQLCKTSLDSSKITRLLSGGDERNELQAKYGLDVEYSEQYTFKKS